MTDAMPDPTLAIPRLWPKESDAEKAEYISWVISGDAISAELEVCSRVREWLIEVGLEHARSRGSKHKSGHDRIDREDIEYAGQHLDAVMQLSLPEATDAK